LLFSEDIGYISFNERQHGSLFPYLPISHTQFPRLARDTQTHEPTIGLYTIPNACIWGPYESTCCHRIKELEIFVKGAGACICLDVVELFVVLPVVVTAAWKWRVFSSSVGVGRVADTCKWGVVMNYLLLLTPVSL
jgi:hypothetical protein